VLRRQCELGQLVAESIVFKKYVLVHGPELWIQFQHNRHKISLKKYGYSYHIWMNLFPLILFGI